VLFRSGELEVKDLLQEAYILVKHIGFSYEDVKTLTRTERATFIQLLSEEMEQEKNALSKHN
jgi:hypothetical protein